MNTENISKQISKLPIIENDDFFLKYKSTMSKEYARTIVGKNIYFTWNHRTESKSNEVEIIKAQTSGKVLEYKENMLRVYTHYAAMTEQDLNNPNDLKDNKFIQDILLEDITDIAEFTDYRFEGWEILPDDYYGKIYEITNTQGKTITALTYDCDGVNIYLSYRKDNNIMDRNKYPLSLISTMKLISE